MATFTPTTPVNKTVQTTTTSAAHTCKFSRLMLCYSEVDGSLESVCGIVQNYDSGGSLIPNTETGFELRVADSAAVATKLAEVSDGVDGKEMTIKKAVYELLQSETNPATGSPYLPAGSVS